MCGIYCCFNRGSVSLFGPSQELQARLDRRGPSCQRQHSVSLSGKATLSFYSTVLSLRGPTTVPQPLVDTDSGCVLCWNGEAWRINGNQIMTNDTAVVFTTLVEAAQNNIASAKRTLPHDYQQIDHIIVALSCISGPFAFVFFDGYTSKLYYGRDYLGRRSLLVNVGLDGFSLASVSDVSRDWKEVPANGIHLTHLRDVGDARQGQRSQEYDGLEAELDVGVISWASLGNVPTLNRETLPPAASSRFLNSESEAVIRLHNLLNASLLLRLSSMPLMDSSRYGGGAAKGLNDNADYWQTDLERLPAIAGLARENTCRLAILFSGGLDCTVLARLVHDLLPLEVAIDLLNVAFENPRNRSQVTGQGQTIYDLCPDRITGRASASELQSVCPGRIWRFVEIDVPYLEMQQHRETVVSLIFPHDTEMDLSIALALYFASRGKGAIMSLDGQRNDYRSSARVLLSGLGADELFGGYQRHETAFRTRGFRGLIEELDLDFGRLGKRNLGRDDRVLSHWGKEVRYPYLDEALVLWATGAPVWQKCGFRPIIGPNEDVPKGIQLEPGKLVLRLLARAIGMEAVAHERKRAIQFGARTAKLEGKTTGTATISKAVRP